MFERLTQTVAGVILIAAGTGCTTIDIEYDRMTGTTYPPPQTVAGSTVTITSIYASAGYLVGVGENDKDIAPLTGLPSLTDPDQYDYITNAELDLLELARRYSPVKPTSKVCFVGGSVVPTYCISYYIYGVVVNHYFEANNGTRYKSTMGKMWGTDNRRAFANFYKNTAISGDGGKFLRSTVHEIGHALNLHHQDGDGLTDIMNQTRIVGSNYVFSFVAAASKEHLRDHAPDCRWPGMSVFGAVHPNHADHGITTRTCH